MQIANLKFYRNFTEAKELIAIFNISTAMHRHAESQNVNQCWLGSMSSNNKCSQVDATWWPFESVVNSQFSFAKIIVAGLSTGMIESMVRDHHDVYVIVHSSMSESLQNRVPSSVNSSVACVNIGPGNEWPAWQQHPITWTNVDSIGHIRSHYRARLFKAQQLASTDTKRPCKMLVVDWYTDFVVAREIRICQ